MFAAGVQINSTMVLPSVRYLLRIYVRATLTFSIPKIFGISLRRRRIGNNFINMANLNYPTLRPHIKGEHTVDIPEGQYGVPDVMLHGLQPGKKMEKIVHPLEHSEKHWNENKRMMDFAMLRNTQGLHAPLKLQMELHIAKKMSRLPCLASSNIMFDTLTGRDDLLDFDDIFNSPFEAEMVGQPHLLMETREGIL